MFRYITDKSSIPNDTYLILHIYLVVGSQLICINDCDSLILQECPRFQNVDVPLCLRSPVCNNPSIYISLPWCVLGLFWVPRRALWGSVRLSAHTITADPTLPNKSTQRCGFVNSYFNAPGWSGGLGYEFASLWNRLVLCKCTVFVNCSICLCRVEWEVPFMEVLMFSMQTYIKKTLVILH